MMRLSRLSSGLWLADVCPCAGRFTPVMLQNHWKKCFMSDGKEDVFFFPECFRGQCCCLKVQPEALICFSLVPHFKFSIPLLDTTLQSFLALPCGTPLGRKRVGLSLHHLKTQRATCHWMAPLNLLQQNEPNFHFFPSFLLLFQSPIDFTFDYFDYCDISSAQK